MKKKIMTVLAVLCALYASQAMALTGLDRADNRCKVEVNYFIEATGGKVAYPATRFTKETGNAYFIHYKKDLKATARFKDGSMLPLDIRCTIEKGSLKPLFVNVNGKSLPIN